MSRTRPTDLEALAVELPCSYCGAEPGSWCVTARGLYPGGVWAAWLHTPRRRPVDDLWRYGYLQGVVEGLDEAIAEMLRPGPWTRTLERTQENRAWWARELAEYDN